MITKVEGFFDPGDFGGMYIHNESLTVKGTLGSVLTVHGHTDLAANEMLIGLF